MADGTYCFARLRVARANRAVTIFAMFRFAFSHPFSGLCRIRSFYFATCLRFISYTHTAKALFIPSRKLVFFVRSIASQAPLFHSLHPHPCPTPKATLHSKKSRQPCHFVVGVQRTSCYLCPPPSLHSQTARASPFHKPKNHFANFSLVPFRLRAVLPVRFIPLRPHTAPDHPPLKFS